MFTLAHMSDVHLSPLPRPRPGQLLNKRLLGFLNWHAGRKTVHRRETLDALVEDLERQAPDHIAVTGDLVNISLPDEFGRALDWLRALGPPDRVTVVPGNHDAYVDVPEDAGIGRWSDYMRPDPDGAAASRPGRSGFPFVRRAGEVALIGLSSAVPTAPFLASGRLDAGQLAALPAVLSELGSQDCFRVVLVHHPPIPGLTERRRALHDARALEAILRDEGAELVLYGHNHAQSVAFLQGNGGPCPVVGVPSASAAGHGRTPLARYNLFRISRANGTWSCEMSGRGYRRPGGPLCQIERTELAGR